ncbi:hypothetical protein ALP71_200230 [Pseudomonas coronafaciens pv. garcae]|nr:hypothetical protein ALP71_200230 [Pseudomonas coronafaciens pv. garcae]
MQTEASDQYKLALVLRVQVDGSTFHGCPACDGCAPNGNDSLFKTCNDDVFLPDSNPALKNCYSENDDVFTG